MEGELPPLVLTGLLLALTLVVSALARHSTRTSIGFYLAGRRVGPLTNAAAICGDYFSAASFLGVAAAVYSSGLDGIWFGAGFGAGFLPVLLLIAAPIRRFGEYSIPDFLGERFESPALRAVAVAGTQVVIILYLLPQAVAVGLTWELLIGGALSPLSAYQTGVLGVAVLMVLYVAMGGMKGTTWNQVIHLALFMGVAIFVVIAALLNGFRYPSAVEELSRRPMVEARSFTRAYLSEDPEGRRLLQAARGLMSEASYADVEAMVDDGALPPSTPLWILVEQKNRLHQDRPMIFREPGHRYGAWDQFAAILSLILGTAGLPHVINRYFTTPTGSMARASTSWVLVLVAAFYGLMTLVGVAARQWIPRAAGEDPWLAAITVDGYLKNPEQAVLSLGHLFGGDLGLALVTAGTFAAILSTMAGLLMAGAASWGHDVYQKLLKPQASDVAKVRVGRLAVVGMGAAAAAAGSLLPGTGLLEEHPAVLALMVTWAFSVAASTFFPVFVAAIWWPRTTARGALAGTVTGLVLSLGFLLVVVGRALAGWGPPSLWGLTYPTLFSLPAASLAIVVGSYLDRPPDPEGTARTWIRLHGTALDRTYGAAAWLDAAPGHPFDLREPRSASGDRPGGSSDPPRGGETGEP